MSVKKILAQVRKADEMFGLIEDGDRIAVGVSGGKDSSLLLYCLHLYQYLAKNALNKSFELTGIHIDLDFGEDDMK
ncbi:MAG: tRNA 2-thiocytidine(32) synthetase TtcA, partial [Erysipelotrichaceae bacterium]|nr:tRNA 2-thiocytidine(32) synthetase TtcA [Erysipelotrichaceae bacterium]